MKKKSIILGLIVFLGLGSAIMISNSAQDTNQADLSGFGKTLQADYKRTEQKNLKKIKSKEAIYAQGKNCVITKTDMEKAVAYYKAQGLEDDQAEKEAYQYAKENAAFYTKAISEGCNASKEEIDTYVNDMRSSYENKKMDEASLKEFDEIIAQFDSADDYWAYEKTVYEKQLPMIKYNKKLETSYYEKHPDAGEKDWETYFENFKKGLVKEEQFVLKNS